AGPSAATAAGTAAPAGASGGQAAPNANMSSGSVLQSMITTRSVTGSQRRQQVRDGDDGDPHGAVGHSVRQNEVAPVEHRAARIDDVRDVALALRALGAEERLAQLADDPLRIVEVKEDRAEDVAPHGSDTVGDDQPALVGLEGRAAVADLEQLPGPAGPMQLRDVLPASDVGRGRQVEILAIAAGQHHVLSPDPPGEQRHSLVLRGGAAERGDAKLREVVG